MEVTERIIEGVLANGTPDAGWFAARQPGVVRYLETRFAAGGDTLAVALSGAATVHAAYEAALGAGPPRIPSSAVERAEEAVVGACYAGGLGRAGALGRQPALVALVASTVSAPALPLDVVEAGRVGLALAAVVIALDDAVTGRGKVAADGRPLAEHPG